MTRRRRVNVMEKLNSNLENVKNLPLQDAVWKINITEQDHTGHGSLRKVQVEEEHEDCHFVLHMSKVDASSVTCSDQILQSLCQACLNPAVKCPRKPRFCQIMDSSIARPIDLEMFHHAGINVFSSHECKSRLNLAQNLLEDLPWFRSCHGCGRRGAASMFSSCDGCGGALFCDQSCKTQTEHVYLCERFKACMDIEQDLGCFPFTFASTTTSRKFNAFRVREFLKKKGVHGKGLWMRECKLSLQSYYFIPFGEMELGECPYGIPGDNEILTSSWSPFSYSCYPDDWAAYYKLRSLNLSSPVAGVLHYALTLVWIVTHCLPEQYPEVFESIKDENSLCIHVIGAAKEADLRLTFRECGQLLLPLTAKLHICLIGPELSERLPDHPEVWDHVTCSLHQGLYHDVQDSLPRGQLAISFNAGLGAYTEYRPTVDHVVSRGMPYFCTDYCLASYRQSCDAIQTAGIASVSPPKVNPFRSPLRMVYTDTDLPRYSNAIVFSLHQLEVPTLDHIS